MDPSTEEVENVISTLSSAEASAALANAQQSAGEDTPGTVRPSNSPFSADDLEDIPMSTPVQGEPTSDSTVENPATTPTDSGSVAVLTDAETVATPTDAGTVDLTSMIDTTNLTASPTPDVFCGLCDLQTVNNLQAACLGDLTKAAVYATTGTLNAPVSVASELRAELQAALMGGQGNNLNDLKDNIDAFVQGKMGFLTKMAGKTGASFDSKFREERAHLEAAGCWPAEELESFAKKLIRRYDKANNQHCSRGFMFPSELDTHMREECPFTMCTCPHAGCHARFSRWAVQNHDRQCGHKLVPCSEGCEAQVPRLGMKDHVNGPCPLRKVQCPYHDLGCLGLVTVGELGAHVKEHAYLHLSMVYKLASNTQSQIDHLHDDFDRVRGEAATSRGLAESTTSKLTTALATSTALVNTLQSQVKAQQAEIAKLKTVHAEHAEMKVQITVMRAEIQSLMKANASK